LGKGGSIVLTGGRTTMEGSYVEQGVKKGTRARTAHRTEEWTSTISALRVSVAERIFIVPIKGERRWEKKKPCLPEADPGKKGVGQGSQGEGHQEKGSRVGAFGGGSKGPQAHRGRS